MNDNEMLKMLAQLLDEALARPFPHETTSSFEKNTRQE